MLHSLLQFALVRIALGSVLCFIWLFISALHGYSLTIALDGSALAEAALLPTAYLVAALAAPAQGSLHLTRVVQRPGIGAILNGRERRDPLQRDKAIKEAINYLCQTADTLRTSLAGDLHLAVTWSVAAYSDVAGALIRVAEMGRVDAGTSVFGGCDILALQHPHSAAEDQMRGDSLKLVEAIEAAMGCNRKI